MADLTLKPIVSEKKSESTKVQFAKDPLFGNVKNEKVSIKGNVIGKWTIEKEERCNICWVNIKPGEPFTRCTSCNNKFHVDHWRDWIINKQSCPICKAKTTY